MTTSTTNSDEPSDEHEANTTGALVTVASDELTQLIVDAAIAPRATEAKQLEDMSTELDTEDLAAPRMVKLRAMLTSELQMDEREFVGYPTALDPERHQSMRERWTRDKPLGVRIIRVLFAVLDSAPGDEIGDRARDLMENAALEILDGSRKSNVDDVFRLLQKHRQRMSPRNQADLIAQMLKHLDEGDVAADTPEVEVITAALETPDDDLRRRALEFEGPLWDDVRTVGPLVALLDDDNQKIRRRTFELLGEHHPEQTSDRVEDLLKSGEFGDRSVGELQFLFRHYADLGDERIKILRECVSKSRGWFGTSSHRAIRAAAGVLLERGDPQAVELIRERANSLLTAPKLKTSLRELLDLHGVS